MIPSGINWDLIARVFGEVLTVVAILLAIGHSLGLKTHVKTMGKLTVKLNAVEDQLRDKISNAVQEIREALPTKRLGKFPSFLPQIVELVNKANSSVTIFCDYPAYGSFSDPETFRRYHGAIEDKIGQLKKKVTIACLGAKSRREETRRQEARDPEVWEEYKRIRHDAFHRYFEFHTSSVDVSVLTNDEFMDTIIREDDQALEHIFRGATILEVYPRPTIYFWLIDDSSMIFVIPSATRLDEFGFYTQDSHLIASFKEIARACSPLYGGPLSTSVGIAS